MFSSACHFDHGFKHLNVTMGAEWSDSRSRLPGFVCTKLVWLYPLDMIEQGQIAPAGLEREPGKRTLLIFFETDCPTCQLALPYLNPLAKAPIQFIGISQDDEASTREFVRQLHIEFPVQVDDQLKLSRTYDPQSVPTIFLLDE